MQQEVVAEVEMCKTGLSANFVRDMATLSSNATIDLIKISSRLTSTLPWLQQQKHSLNLCSSQTLEQQTIAFPMLRIFNTGLLLMVKRS